MEALLRKLERELYRAYHHKDRIHKADHFFNFCITAHSMRDHFFERLGKVTPVAQQPYHDQWAQMPLLVAAKEIANSTKHFALRDMKTRALRTPKAQSVRLGTSTYAHVYVSDEGRTMVVPRKGPNIFVVLSDNKRHELYSFMSGVLEYWRDFLRKHGIRVRQQSFAKLRGSVT